MRQQRLDAYLEEEGLEAVWFARPNNFAWLTAGDNVVDRGAPTGIAAAGYDGDGVTVVTNNIEAPRLAAEELADDVSVESDAWYEESLAEAVAERSPTPAAADFDVPGLEQVDVSPLRQPLSARDVETYRELGRTAAAALERVARDVTPETTERAAAADLRGELAARGVESPVALVGGAERSQQYRHFTPKPVVVGGYAILSAVAVQDGLHASLTRTVAFDPPEWLEERFHVAATVEATALAATREHAGTGTAGDVFDAIADAYEAHGWGGEWRNHHQGGAAGFAGREWRAMPGGEQPVTEPMAYAYNPTVQGAKSEGTALVTSEDVEPLALGGDWPTVTAEAEGYDLAVERPAILER